MIVSILFTHSPNPNPNQAKPTQQANQASERESEASEVFAYLPVCAAIDQLTFPSKIGFYSGIIVYLPKFNMRKLSKSRADDEKSSNNGSTINDEQMGNADEGENNTQEKDSDTEKVVSADDKDDADEEPATPKPARSKKKKGKATKTKASKTKGRKPKPVVNEADNDDEVDEEYEVEKVIDSKRIKGKLHYLIRWKGYSSDTDTWEPEDTLSCPDLISKFNEEKENDGNKTSKTHKTKGKKRKSKSDTKSPAKKAKTSWDSKSADSNAEYEVERILEVRVKKNGKREFMIHWKGWSNKFDSWEPEANLNCSDLIEKFMEKVESARNTDSRNLRVAPGSTNRFTLQTQATGRRLSKRHGQRQRVRYDDAE